MSQPLFILSPCGTSLLTNYEDKRLSSLARQYANAKELNDIPKEDAALLTTLVAQAGEALKGAGPDQASKASAELNGIIKLYDGQRPKGQDHHVVLSTDTWLGEQTASMVAEWLRDNGQTVEVKRQSDLQTRDIDGFQLALSDLVGWCEETIPGYRASRYRIVFNLTGGFKSVQGFLMVLATFYADETVYVFESSQQLLRIPRLPVRMDAAESVRKNLTIFRRISIGLPVTDCADIPETFLFKMDGNYTLSQWGELVWLQTRSSIYQEKLYPPPIDRIRYGVQFERTLRDVPKERITLVNERIDQLARHLTSNGSYNPRSLDFKGLQCGNLDGATHEMDAWADGDARRLFGHFEGNVFVLDRLDKGLH